MLAPARDGRPRDRAFRRAAPRGSEGLAEPLRRGRDALEVHVAGRRVAGEARIRVGIADDVTHLADRRALARASADPAKLPVHVVAAAGGHVGVLAGGPEGEEGHALAHDAVALVADDER